MTAVASLYRVLALARKELLAILKDPRGRASLLIPPILQCLIFGYAATYDLNAVPYAVLDLDRSAASTELLARFDGSRVFQRVANLSRAADISTFIDEQRALVVIQIDPGFARALSAGRPAALQVIADGRNSNTAGTASAYVGAIVQGFNTEWRAAHGQPGPTLRVMTRAWYNPNLETRWAMVPMLVVTLTLNQSLLLTAMSVAREREEGTLDQLLVTPFRPAEIMAGKALPSILVALVQATNALLVSRFWFHIPFAGSVATLYLGVGVFLLATVGVGLFVSSIAATLQQAMLYSFLVMMPFVLLSGLTTPVSSMPQALQIAMMVNPLRFAIDMAQRVYLEGAGVRQIAGDLWPMALIGAATLTGAAWTFRRRLG